MLHKRYATNVLLLGLLTFSCLSLTFLSNNVARADPPIAMGTNYTTGKTPTSVVYGDFNEDGFIDLAVANTDDNSVSVFINKGDGTFAPAITYPVGSHPRSLVMGDLKKNGQLSLVVANSGDNTITVLMNHGDGAFNIKHVYQIDRGTFSYVNAVAIGDFNGDGYNDIVVTDSLNTAVVLFNKADGSGNFAAGDRYKVGKDPISVKVADLNGDGHPDIITANALDNSVTVLLNKGDGSFAQPVSYTGLAYISDIALGDFNGDGYTDIAALSTSRTAIRDSRVNILVNEGNGTFTTNGSFVTGKMQYALTTGDFNSDGNMDLALASSMNRNVRIFFNDGKGNFTAGPHYYVGGDPDALAVADLNHDGLADLVVANATRNTITVYLTQTQPADVGITNTDQGGPFSPGQNVNYTLTVNNATTVGPVIQRNSIFVIDVIPAGLQNIVATGQNWYIQVDQTTSPAHVIAYYSGTYPVPAGTVLTPLTVSGTLTGAVGSNLTTTAIVSAPSDSNQLNNASVDTIVVTA